MNLPTTFAIAIASLTVAAYAEPGAHHAVRRGLAELNIDANNDGWISRAEAGAAAERIFADLDSNDDGRLTRDDRPEPGDGDFLEGRGHRFHGDRNCTTTVEEEAPSGDARRIERRVTVVCEGDETEARGGDGERRQERHVIIRRGDDHPHGEARAPHPPRPPHPPMMAMIFAHSEEADLNNDGGLSLDEFRAQQLRFFDASDANRDGRVRFTPPPAPPEPPAPPAPPAPPR